MTAHADTILTQILAHKRVEVERQMAKLPQAQIERRIANAPPARDFAAVLRQPERVTLIAEVKKASPSKGVLLEQFDPLAIAATYRDAGAAAISVLTDLRFFQGSVKYLEAIRGLPHIPPLLRKDFIIDPYQIYEARAYAADALLLIAAALDDTQLGALLALTYELGMHALIEVHDVVELERALAVGAHIIGVNNRNLHTFETTLATTEAIAAHLPTKNRPILVSESGIFTPADVARVRACGADAVLVGEALITADDIGAKTREIAGVTDPRRTRRYTKS